MGRRVEGIQITVKAEPSANGFHRFMDSKVGWLPGMAVRAIPAVMAGNLLPESWYPYRSVVIPRDPHAGKDLSLEEVARVHAVLPEVARQLPLRRQPLTSPTEVDMKYVSINRVHTP